VNFCSPETVAAAERSLCTDDPILELFEVAPVHQPEGYNPSSLKRSKL